MWSFFKLIGKAMGLRRDSPNPPDSEAIPFLSGILNPPCVVDHITYTRRAYVM